MFGVFFFIGGWEGLVPATIYHTLLSKVAAHGFIVVGPWPLSSDEPEDRDVVYTALLWVGVTCNMILVNANTISLSHFSLMSKYLLYLLQSIIPNITMNNMLQAFTLNVMLKINLQH